MFLFLLEIFSLLSREILKSSRNWDKPLSSSSASILAKGWVPWRRRVEDMAMKVLSI
jgi:hypothetical protein